MHSGKNTCDLTTGKNWLGQIKTRSRFGSLLKRAQCNDKEALSRLNRDKKKNKKNIQIYCKMIENFYVVQHFSDLAMLFTGSLV